MPRYFFHLHNDIESIDHEGIELSDRAQAIRHAMSNAREMAAQSVREGHLILSHRIEITDANGRTLEQVTFGQAVVVKG